MMTIFMFVLIGIWVIYRRFVSMLDVPKRKIIFKSRVQGLLLAGLVSILLEAVVGKSFFGSDPKFDLLAVPLAWLVVFCSFEWMGDQELKKLGVKTRGPLAKKFY
jgi:hypothetical protein